MLHANNMQIARSFKQEFGVFNTSFSDLTWRFYSRCTNPNNYVYNFNLAWPPPPTNRQGYDTFLVLFVFGFVVVSSILNCFTCKLALLDLANTSFLRMEFRLKREWKHSVGSSGHSVCQGIKAECFSDLQQLNFIWLLQRPSFLGWQVNIAERERKNQKTEDLKLQQTLHTCNNRISNTHISRKALYWPTGVWEGTILICFEVLFNIWQFLQFMNFTAWAPWIYVCIYVHVAQCSRVS